MQSPVEIEGAGGYQAEPNGATDASKVGPVVGRPELVARHPELARVDWKHVDARFPIRVPRGWAPGQEPELLIQALPDARELGAAPRDVRDRGAARRMSPRPGAVRKPGDRVLLLPTKRCHLSCRYCSRADQKRGGGDAPTPPRWAAMLDYARHSGAREVMLSGGDPLALRDERLFEAIDAVRPEVPVIRIHTRAPITSPGRVTPELVAGLRARAPVWMLVHCNHPAELTPDVRRVLGTLVDAGLPVLNQSVLLRGVNAGPDVLARLSEELVALRVFPYYLHHPDPVPGNAHFRVSLEEGRAIYAELARRVSGIGLPRYVIDPPDGTGKRDLGA